MEPSHKKSFTVENGSFIIHYMIGLGLRWTQNGSAMASQKKKLSFETKKSIAKYIFLSISKPSWTIMIPANKNMF